AIRGHPIKSPMRRPSVRAATTIARTDARQARLRKRSFHCPVTTFSYPTSRSAATVTMPLPAFVAGAPADVRGTLVAVHFRDERGFAIFSLEQPDGSRVRALGQLPPEMTLQAVVRVGGLWSR